MNKNATKAAVPVSALLLSFSVAASNLNTQFYLVPYLGVGAEWRHMEFKKDYGKNVTKSNYPQGNIYAGVKLNENLAFEAGYEQSTTLKRNTTLPGVTTVFGISLPAILGVNQYNIKTKIHGFHVNAVGFLPISKKYRLELIGSVGVARSKVKMSLDIPIFDSRPDTNHRDFSKSKWIPKIGVGLQHMLTSQFGIRGMVNWEGTSRFKDVKVVNVPSTYRARLKDSFGLGLSIFYNFK